MDEHGDEADRIIGLYARHAADWAERRRFNDWEQRWLDRFCALMPEKGARVLELGCGSGAPWGKEMLARGIDLTGVDAAAEMIEIASVQEGRWIHSDMRGLSLGERFDGVLAWNSMFHLRPEDQREMFAVFAAHAKEGAVLMFTSGPRAGVEMGTYKGEPLYHASLARDEFHAILDAHGFDVRDHVVEDAASGGHTIWLARGR